jgi:hypothetical protein
LFAPDEIMTDFAITSETSATSTDVLQSAVTTLISNGFAMTNRDASSATLTGPGQRSTKQNPILGASRIVLRIDNGILHVDAELGGVDSMRRFVMWFPFLLGLGLGLAFTVVGGLTFGRIFGVGFGVPWAQGWRWVVIAMGSAFLPVAPWIVLSPMLVNIIRKRTHRALQTLVENATQQTLPGQPQDGRP